MDTLSRRRKPFTLGRFLIPLGITLVLFLTEMILRRRSLVVGEFGDIREALFGKDLRLLQFAVFVGASILLIRIVDTFLFDVVMSRRGQANVPVLLRDVVSLGLYFFLIGSALSFVFDWKITALLTSATVVAAIIGLALQDTLGNLLSGISLHLESTLEPGDVVRVGSLIGVIESVNWRAARLRTFDDSRLVVPNSVLARESLEVFPVDRRVARIVTVGVSYDAPPGQVIEVLQRAASSIEDVLSDPPCLVRVGAFDSSSVRYEIKYWTRAYSRVPATDAAIRRAVWYALRRNHMTIPFPIVSLHRMPPPMHGPDDGVERIAERIRSVDLFTPLSDEQLDALTRATRVRVFGQGETVLRQGDEGHSMFIVDEGEISVRMETESEESTEVGRLGPGEFFGETALLTGESRNADVIALSEVVAFEIGKESLQPILQAAPELASALSMHVSERKDVANMLTRAEEGPQGVLARIRAYFGIR